MSVILHLHIRVPGDQKEAFLSFLREARPFYEQIPGTTVRLLQNVNSPEELIEVIEYATREAYDADAVRLEGDQTMISYLSRWKMLLSSPARVETYEELTEKLI